MTPLRRTRRRALAVAGLTVPIALGLVGCSRDDKGMGDAPVGQRHEAPRQVWNSPDGFANIAAFCIGVNGAYVHTREAAPVIVANDPNCAEGGLLA